MTASITPRKLNIFFSRTLSEISQETIYKKRYSVESRVRIQHFLLKK